MKIQLNGTERETEGEVTVAEIVAMMAADPELRGVAVALDGEVVPRSAWPATSVAEGQQVEVLEARQGG
jgi:sulfur carrier protein